MKLKSTGQEVHPMPWGATTTKPWPRGYTRVLIPNTNKKHRSHVQIVNNSNLE